MNLSCGERLGRGSSWTGLKGFPGTSQSLHREAGKVPQSMGTWTTRTVCWNAGALERGIPEEGSFPYSWLCPELLSWEPPAQHPSLAEENQKMGSTAPVVYLNLQVISSAYGLLWGQYLQIWYMKSGVAVQPIILVPQEAEIRRIMFWGQLWQKSYSDPVSTNKKLGVVRWGTPVIPVLSKLKRRTTGQASLCINKCETLFEK
jgi:hypothetical protein